MKTLDNKELHEIARRLTNEPFDGDRVFIEVDGHEIDGELLNYDATVELDPVEISPRTWERQEIVETRIRQVELQFYYPDGSVKRVDYDESDLIRHIEHFINN